MSFLKNKTNINSKLGGAIPKDKALYDEIKSQIYEKNRKHSLYRSAQVVREYKRRGGEFEEKALPLMNINKWFNQKWLSANDYYHDNKEVPCGNSDTQAKYGEYPLCRPKAILDKLTKPQLKKMIDEKNKIKSKHLKTSKILNTDKFNIKSTNTGL